MAAAPKKVVVDWERVESDYRAGLLSVREIAATHGISHTYINRRVKEKNWTRDLSARIQAKAESIVSSAVVSNDVSTDRLETDAAIVSANAEVIARVRLNHRKDIVRFRNVALALLDELEVQTGNRELFDELGELLRSPDEKGIDKINDIYNKVISGAGRIDGVKKLAETLKILIGLEREAYGLVENVGKDDAADNLATALEAARKRRRDALAQA